MSNYQAAENEFFDEYVEVPKYQVIDDSMGDIHGSVLFESNCRIEASNFHDAHEDTGNNVAILQRNPAYKG